MSRRCIGVYNDITRFVVQLGCCSIYWPLYRRSTSDFRNLFCALAVNNLQGYSRCASGIQSKRELSLVSGRPSIVTLAFDIPSQSFNSITKFFRLWLFRPWLASLTSFSPWQLLNQWRQTHTLWPRLKEKTSVFLLHRGLFWLQRRENMPELKRATGNVYYFSTWWLIHIQKDCCNPTILPCSWSISGRADWCCFQFNCCIAMLLGIDRTEV